MDKDCIIEKYGLEPHPEGGFFRRLYADSGLSTIYYLLADSDFSAFHRLNGMTEIWYYHEGAPLLIYVIEGDGSLAVHRLSPLDEMQVVIRSGQWFAAEVEEQRGFCLVGCAVSPAFDYSGFELARRDLLLSLYPQHARLINRLCRGN